MSKQVERCVIEKGFLHRTSPPGVKYIEVEFDEEATRELSPLLQGAIRTLFVIDIQKSAIADIKFALRNRGMSSGYKESTVIGDAVPLNKALAVYSRVKNGEISFVNSEPNFYLKFSALLMNQISMGVPVSSELMTALLVKYGALEEDILANNMSMRTLLYLLKQTAALQIFCDDPHYDGTDEQRKLIVAAKKSLKYLDGIHNIYEEELQQLPTYPLFDPLKIQAKVDFVVEQVYALYLTNAGTVTDADDFFRYFISEKKRCPAETFDILANAMIIVRAYLLKNQNKINAYHREVFKDRY